MSRRLVPVMAALLAALAFSTEAPAQGRGERNARRAVRRTSTRSRAGLEGRRAERRGSRQRARRRPTERLRRGTAMRRLLGNVSDKGAVVAAPSGQPNYQFHWVRDAAISMKELVSETSRARRPAERRRLIDRYKRYVEFTHNILDRQAKTGAGEPKYHMDGRPFDGPWARPQNDGPAARALVNIEFAETLLKSGKKADREYVEKNLFASRGSHDNGGRLIESDLDYTAKNPNWNHESWDLWEESNGYHFYTRLMQHQALVRGAKLAEQMNRPELAKRYRKVAGELAKALQDHVAEDGTLVSSFFEDGSKRGLDTSVLLGILQTYGPDSPYRALDDPVLATADALEDAFRKEYPVNKTEKAGRATLIGRYSGDRYTGLDQRDNGGNPWALATNAFAELHYRVAEELSNRTEYRPDKHAREFLLRAVGKADADLRGALEEGATLRGARLERLRSLVLERGDDFLNAVLDNADADGKQHEQIHRDSAEMVGAKELTWNYASYLSALRAREEAGAAD